MRKFIFSLVLVCIFNLVVCLAFASDDDQWLGQDKIVHFGVSFVAAEVGYNFYKKVFILDQTKSKLAAFFTVLAAGAIKESLDDEFSHKDMAANALGAGLGVTFTIDF